jgi:DNA repair exonuclease SbcCD ATPase subunit
MIKLYFNHALKNEEGITRLPKLDARCVTKAFEEMRRGYEDDGLFDEMIQFFLPLTVNDHELVLDANEIHLNTEEKRRTQSQYEKEIRDLIRDNEKIIENIENQKKIIVQIKDERQRMYERLESDLQETKTKRLNTYAKEKNEFEQQWSRKDNIQSDKIKKIKKDIGQMETNYKANETLIKEKRNLLNTIIDDLNNQETYIDDKLVKPHRGFIMYGPPGNEFSS